MVGIYKIQSKIKPERIYIGSAVNFYKRCNSHKHSLRKGKHGSKKLQNHYNKYGEKDLEFSILLGCDKESLIEIEQFFIDSYNPWFNINPTAGSNLGRKFSEDPNRKRKDHEYYKGHIPWNKGTKGVMGFWNKGRHPTEESKQKNREWHKKYGSKPPNQKGYKWLDTKKLEHSKRMKEWWNNRKLKLENHDVE